MGILSVDHSKISRSRKRTGFLYHALAFFLISTLVLAVIPSSASAKTSSTKPKKETKWVLEFKWVATSSGGQVTTTGEVRFLVPKSGGRVEAEGPMNLTGPSGETGQGVMVIEGNVRNKRLIFVPDQKSMTITAGGYTTNLEIFQIKDKIRMPFRDGAKLVQRGSDPTGKTETTWQLKGREEWRITEDYRQLVPPSDPLLLDLPVGHKAGLIVKWRLVLDFAIEGGEYVDGTGKFSVVKWDSYSKPPGLYKVIYPKYHFRRKTEFIVPGKKSGSWVTFTLPTENYLEVLYRVVTRKEGRSKRVEGQPLRLPGSLRYELVERRQEFLLYPMQTDLKKRFVRGKPKVDFWEESFKWGKKYPLPAHVVVVIKRIR